MILQVPIHDPHYILSVIESCKDVSPEIKDTLKRVLDLSIIKNGVEEKSLSVIFLLVRAKILTIQDKERIKSFLQKGLASKDRNAQITLFLTIQKLQESKILTDEEILPFLEKGMARNDIQGIISSIIESLDKENIMPFLEKSMQSSNRDVQANTLSVIVDLGRAKILTIQDKEKIMPFLEKGMASDHQLLQNAALTAIEELGEAKILMGQEMLSFLEKGVTSTNSDVRYRAVSEIVKLVETKILTAQEIMPYKEKIMVSLEEGMADDYPPKTLSLIQRLVTVKILTSQNKKELLSWVEKGMTNSSELVQQNALEIIQELLKAKIVTSQDSTQLLSLLEKGMGSRDLEQSILRLVVKLVESHVVTGSQVLPLLEYAMRQSDSLYHVFTILKGLVKDQMVDASEILPLLETGIRRDRATTGNTTMEHEILGTLQEYVKNNLIKASEVIPFLQKGIEYKKTAYYTLVVIQQLIEAKKITLQEVMPLLEKGLQSKESMIKSKAGEILKESSLLSFGLAKTRGLLRKTGILSMRHDPYATISTDLMKQQGISREAVEQQEARVRAHVAEMGQNSDYQIPDLETQRQQFLEQQQMMQQGLERFSGEQAAHHVAPRIPYLIPRLAQQRRLAARQLLKKPADVARKGARAIVR